MLQSHFSMGYHVEPDLTAEIKSTRMQTKKSRCCTEYSTGLQQSHCLRTSHVAGNLHEFGYLSSGSTFNPVSLPYPGPIFELIVTLVAVTIG